MKDDFLNSYSNQADSIRGDNNQNITINNFTSSRDIRQLRESLDLLTEMIKGITLEKNCNGFCNKIIAIEEVLRNKN